MENNKKQTAVEWLTVEAMKLFTQAMTGTTLRSVRITGTFTHTGNVAVALRGQTSVANLTVAGGASLSYTRIG